MDEKTTIVVTGVRCVDEKWFVDFSLGPAQSEQIARDFADWVGTKFNCYWRSPPAPRDPL